MKRRARGLTLIEVLVTVSIIILLMSIAVPGLKTVQDASRGARCSANLRQLGTAALTYASNNNDRMPAAILFIGESTGLRTVCWDTEQLPDGSVRPGPMWTYSDAPTRGNGELLQCPAFDGPSTFGGDLNWGYNYNTSYIGAEGRFPEMSPDGHWLDGWSVARAGIPPSQHRRPETTALLGDAGWKGGANKFMRSPSAIVEGDLGIAYSGGQAFRHRGCSHAVFLDGHVTPCDRCCEGELATPQLLEDVMGYPANGFLSEDDSVYDPR